MIWPSRARDGHRARKIVAAGGRLLARIPEPSWRRVFTSATARLDVRWRARPRDFALPARERYPVLKLTSAVISRLEERPMAPGDLHAALLDRAGRWLRRASWLDSPSGSTASRPPPAPTSTCSRSAAPGGDGAGGQPGPRPARRHRPRRRRPRRVRLPLPIGDHDAGSVEEAAGREDELRRELGERGYPHHEPLYTLFFLAADFLPAVRLSPRGVWDVKRSRVLLPSRPRDEHAPRRAGRRRRSTHRRRRGPRAPKKDEPFKRGVLGRRAYRLYAPLKTSAEPRTLVVALHGCWQTPEDFARGTRLNDAAGAAAARALSGAEPLGQREPVLELVRSRQPVSPGRRNRGARGAGPDGGA